MFSSPWPKQNTMTGASLRYCSLYLCLSSISPDREKKDRQRGGENRGEAGAQGTWSVFRRKMPVSSCQSLAFWCHRLGTGLSVSQCNSYQRLTHSRDRRWDGNTKTSSHSPIYTCDRNFVKSGSKKYDRSHHPHLALKQQTSWIVNVVINGWKSS